MSAFVYCVFVSSCLQRPCDWLIPRPSSPTNCVKDQETEKAAKVHQRTVEPQIDRCIDG
jgi:hypothetical protein